MQATMHKKNIFLILFLIAIFQQGIAQQSPIKPKIRQFRKDTIVWKKDSLLSKADFKGHPKEKNELGATACFVFIYPSESGGNLNFHVEAVFIKSKSYLVKNSEAVLKHEQLHFDIAELYARKLRKQISETDFKKVRNIVDVVRKMYDKTANDFKKEENKLDKDTQHGMNSARQQVWVDDIANRLTELDQFSSTEVNIVN